jgi:GntR family transcriptional repressor for pyruvate dehydrogenase complex
VAREELTFEPLERSPSLFEVVSQRLLEAIRERQLAPGSRIPSERDLGEQFGVSRTVIREAVRHLAAKGVLDTSGTGVRVATMDHGTVAESLELFLTARGPIDPQKISEVRETLELATTQLAAQRASDDDLAAITTSCESMAGTEGKAEPAALADVAFHRTIAAAAGNELYLVLIDSLADVMIHIRRATLGDPERGRIALEQHRRIAEALAHRDEEAAVEAMRYHLTDSLHAYERVAPH